MVLVVTQTPIIVFIRLSNKAARTPRTSNVELFVTVHSQCHKELPKISPNIYHYEILSWLTCQLQTNVPLLNPLKISENQRFRFFNVFKGFIDVKNWLEMVSGKHLCFGKFSFRLTIAEFHLGETSNQLIYNENYQLLL